MRFEQVAWLWLAAAAIPLAVLAWRWLIVAAAWRRGLAIAARAVAFALLAAALAGAASRRERDNIAVVAAIDVSGSVRRYAGFGATPDGGVRSLEEAAREFFVRATRGKRSTDRLGVVAFDGAAAAVVAPSLKPAWPGEIAARGLPGTDAASALRLAAALLPADASGRVVLVSDGRETAGDAAYVAGSLRSRPGGGGVRVDVLPIEYDVQNEVVFERLDAPPTANRESPVRLRAVLRAASEASGTLRLSAEGEPVDLNGELPGNGLPISLAPGANVRVIEVPIGAGRLHRFEAVFEPDLSPAGAPVGDTFAVNNAASAFTLAPSGSSVLIVDGVSDAQPGGAGGQLGQTLERAGFAVQTVPSAGTPRSLLALSAFDLIVLQDVPVEDMDDATQALLIDAVEQLGVGLIMIGGEEGFAAGGWKGSPLAAALPVSLDVPDDVVQPEAAIVFVIDKSGSMRQGVLGSARTQQEIANESVVRAIASLEESDLVGVVAFDNAPLEVVRLGPNTAPGEAARDVRGIMPEGGTNVGPALRVARDRLNAVRATLKHVIVLSDGQSQDPETLPTLAQQMRAEGIVVSAIAVGDEADIAGMQSVATAGGGQFYNVVNANVLPRVFLRAVRVVRKPLYREGRIGVVTLPTGSPLMSGIDAPPPLLGFDLTSTRPEAGITHALATETGEPLLAHWQVGLGQVAAFTSDASAWAALWLAWPGYEALWSQIARSLARVPQSDRGVLRVEPSDDGLAVRLDIADDRGSPADGLAVPIVVYDPQGSSQRGVLRQTGPGRYEGDVRVAGAGVHLVVASPTQSGEPLPAHIAGATVSEGREFDALASDRATLARIAEAGGGRLLSLSDPEAAGLFDRADVEPREATTPLWPALLAGALAAFLMDLASRRVAWERLLPSREQAAVAAAAAEPGARPIMPRTRATRPAPAAAQTGETVATQQPAPPPPPLTPADADVVAEAQQRRRAAALDADLRQRRERALERLQRGAGRPAASPSAPPGAAPSTGDAPSEDQPPANIADLLAAKRRAARRFDEGDPDAS